MRTHSAAAIAACLVALAAGARADELVVPTAYQTIGAAIAKAHPGDTIRVNSGYIEPGTVTIGADLAGLTLKGVGKPVIDGAGSVDSGVLVNADGVTVQGFEIRGFRSGAGIRVTSSTTQAAGPQSVTITGNEIWGNSQGVSIDGPNLPGSAQDFVVKYNDIHDNVTNGVRLYQVDGADVKGNVVTANGQGILVDTSGGATVSRNTVGKTAGPTDASTGIAVVNSPGDPKRRQPNVVTSNQVSGGAAAGIFVAGSDGQVVCTNIVLSNRIGIELDNSSNLTVSDNTVSFSAADGIALRIGASKCTVTDNTVTDNGLSGIIADATTSANHIQRNTASGNTWSDLWDDGTNLWANDTFSTAGGANAASIK